MAREGEYYVPEGRRMIPVRWMSPEALTDAKFSSKSDVWAFGVVLWEMCTLGQQPYYGMDHADVIKFVQEEHHMAMPQGCPELLYDIMLQCWRFHSKDRPSFADLVKLLLPHMNQVFCGQSFYCTDYLKQKQEQLQQQRATAAAKEDADSDGGGTGLDLGDCSSDWDEDDDDETDDDALGLVGAGGPLSQPPDVLDRSLLPGGPPLPLPLTVRDPPIPSDPLEAEDPMADDSDSPLNPVKFHIGPSPAQQNFLASGGANKSPRQTAGDILEMRSPVCNNNRRRPPSASSVLPKSFSMPMPPSHGTRSGSSGECPAPIYHPSSNGGTPSSPYALMNGQVHLDV